jgi:hypothetical protein
MHEPRKGQQGDGKTLPTSPHLFGELQKYQEHSLAHSQPMKIYMAHFSSDMKTKTTAFITLYF